MLFYEPVMPYIREHGRLLNYFSLERSRSCCTTGNHRYLDELVEIASLVRACTSIDILDIYLSRSGLGAYCLGG